MEFTTSESSLLEKSLLPLLSVFLDSMFEKFDYSTKAWSWYVNDLIIAITNKEIPIEESLSPLAECTHFLILFLLDFSFVFHSSFCQFDSNGVKTEFEGYDVFANKCLTLIKDLTGNPVRLFEFAFKANCVVNSGSDKAQYDIRDYFSLYGLIMLYFSRRDQGILPLTVSRAKHAEVFEKMGVSLMCFEKEQTYCDDYFVLMNWILTSIRDNIGVSGGRSRDRLLYELILSKHEKIDKTLLEEGTVGGVFEFVESKKDVSTCVNWIKENNKELTPKEKVNALKVVCFENLVDKDFLEYVSKDGFEGEEGEIEKLLSYLSTKNPPIHALLKETLFK